MYGHMDPQTGEYLVKQNVSYAVELMKHAAKEGSLEASANLGRILVTGVYDYKNGSYILRPNASLALFFLNHSI
jgi:TPR repeat protein